MTHTYETLPGCKVETFTPHYVLEFELPGLPKTTNSGGRAHWAVKAKEAAHWKKMVHWATACKGPEESLKRAKLTLTRCSAIEPDFDGLVSSFKHVLDGLVEAQVIENDKPSVIGQPAYRWEKAPPKHGKIKVRIEELK